MQDIQPGESYAFVSYARRDRIRVKEQVSTIREWGHRIWIDEAIRPTDEWPETIARAIQGCSIFVLFLTANSAGSRNVRNEVHFALEETKPILAVYLERTELPGGLRLRIGDIQSVVKPDLNPQQYARLMHRTLGAALGGAPAQPPPARRREPSIDLGNLGL